MKFIINIIGGPGTGKTTICSLVFGNLKIKRYNIEYVQEYAKNLVWRKDLDTLNNQYHVSKSQYDIFDQLSDSVDYIITDGSLLHGLYYNRTNPDNTSNIEKTERKILEWFNQFLNLTIFLERNPNVEYQQSGRLQSKNQAIIVDQELKKILDHYKIKYQSIELKNNYQETVDQIIEIVEKHKSILTNFTS